MVLNILRLGGFHHTRTVKMEIALVQLEHGANGRSPGRILHLSKVFAKPLSEWAFTHADVHEDGVGNAWWNARLNHEGIHTGRIRNTTSRTGRKGPPLPLQGHRGLPSLPHLRPEKKSLTITPSFEI